jgi:ABC-type xylose transport system permease subunit
MAENNPQLQDVQKRAEDMLHQLGIDIPMAITVLVLALVSGLVAGIIDAVLEMPDFSSNSNGNLDGNLLFFGAFIVVLNGATYAFLKKKDDVPGAIMAAVAGFVTFLFWWIVTKIMGDQEIARGFSINPADAFNLLEVIFDGVILGLIGFGWFMLLKRLPDISGMLKRG